MAADPVTAAHGDGLLTAADLAFEPDDGLRRELYDGVMHVVPPPGDTHSWQVLALYRLLYATAPGDVFVLHDVGVHVGLRRLFVAAAAESKRILRLAEHPVPLQSINE